MTRSDVNAILAGILFIIVTILVTDCNNRKATSNQKQTTPSKKDSLEDKRYIYELNAYYPFNHSKIPNNVKGLLEFALPDDQREFEIATKAHDWYLVSWDMDQYLRNQLKYENLSEDKRKTLEDTRNMLHKFMVAKGLALE